MRKFKPVFFIGILLSSLSVFCQEKPTIVTDLSEASEEKMFTTTVHPNYHKPAGGVCGDVLCNGQFAILMDNGTVPYTIDLSNGESYVTSYNYFLFDSLCVGTYTYTVTDDLGSVAVDSVTITQTPGVTAIVDTVLHVLCPGALTGLAGIEVLTGEAPFTHALNFGPAQNQPYFTGLPAGGYNVTITDAFGCTGQVNFSIAQPSPFNVSFTNNNSCSNECNGSVTVSSGGATPPYTYSSDNGLSYQASNVLLNLCQGNQNIVVKDSNGCLTNSVQVIGGPTSFDIAPTFTEPTCHDLNDGTIDFNVSGGTPGFAYSIDNGPLLPTNPMTNISAGFHELLVVDVAGCVLTDTITVTQPPDNQWLLIASNPPNCLTNDGSFEVALVPPGVCPPFIYSIDGGLTFQSTGFFSGLYAGVYTVIGVESCNGCVDTFKVALSDNVMTSTTDYMTDPSCSGVCDGALGVSQSFGTAPFTYTLDYNVSSQSTGDFSGVCGGQHFVTIEDANSCLAIHEVNLADWAPISYKAYPLQPSCTYTMDGSISFQYVQGGDGGPYQYSIDGGSTFQGSAVFTGLSSGTYSTEVMDGNGCITSELVTVPGALPVFGAFTAADVSCNGDSNGFIQLVAISGIPPFTYELDGSLTSNGVYPNLPPDTYAATITDAYGCTYSFSAPINEPPPLTLSIDNSSDPICNGSTNGQITLQASGGTPLYLYSIYSGTILSTSENFNFASGGTYDVYVEDVNGCTATNTITLTDPASTSIDVTSVVPSLCTGPCEGEVEFTMTTGASDFTINHSSGNIAWVSSHDFIIDSICAGNLKIHVADDYGCLDSTEVLIINSSDIIADTSNLVAISCFGACDGEVTIDLSNGLAPYSLSSSGGAINAISGTQYDITAICEGNVQITATDDNGCQALVDLQYIEPDSLYFNYNQLSIGSCTTCNDAAAEVIITGGSAPFSTDWTAFGSSVTTNTANDLVGGTGIVCITDANGCQFCDSVQVDFIDDVGVSEWANEVRIYPNPANEEVLISCASKIDFYQLMDNRGRLILQQTVNATSKKLDLAALPAGVYVIRVFSGQEVTNHKLMIR